ncbi:MAG: DUF3306 domain-containing protein [Burkholderiaceae bacterium]
MNENFLQRWARRKAEYKNGDARPEENGHVAEQASAPHSADLMPEDGAAPLPTLEDVARLSADSDYSRFVSRSIDKTVRRAALKKLFSDPHFNVMDGLDIYIDDYNKASPLTPAMLAGLKHTESLFEAIKKEAEKAEPVPAADLEANDASLARGPDSSFDQDASEPESAQQDQANVAQQASDASGIQSAENSIQSGQDEGDQDEGLQAAQGRS